MKRKLGLGRGGSRESLLDERAWKSRKWFKDDFCEGPGQVLFVHSDGNIAPCCGFANENKELFIGTVSENYQQIMENARHNKMVKICYENGLSKKIKELKRMCMKKGTV